MVPEPEPRLSHILPRVLGGECRSVERSFRHIVVRSLMVLRRRWLAGWGDGRQQKSLHSRSSARDLKRARAYQEGSKCQRIVFGLSGSHQLLGHYFYKGQDVNTMGAAQQ